MTDIGFIGLGLMGRPMAGRLIEAGHRVFLHNRSGVPQELVAAGGIACNTRKEVAEKSAIVFTIVSDTPDVEEVLFGPDGVAHGLGPGKIVVDMSSISPIATREFAKRIEALGCSYLDAPVSGGDIGAKAGTLTIMVGGPEETFETVKPYFAVMGKSITRIGGNGDGQTAKVANQIIVGLTIAAVSEALLFASKAGADPAKVREALMGGFAGSRILEVHAQRMLSHKFTPGFKLALHHKDLAIALDGAKRLKMSLPHTALCQELFNSALGAGDGELDDSALLKVLERLANHELGAPLAKPQD
jgi:2-hydroxy-3-oxopropionate reductase